jgi:ribulose-5-phosphate 4-epimerase/fuculose-1-phosphate aldolase
MKRMMCIFENKLIEQRLIGKDTAIFGEREDSIVWNRTTRLTDLLESVFNSLNISSLLYSRPAEPYWSLLEYLCERSLPVLHLRDNETRTFLHDIPILRDFDPAAISTELRRRKSVYVLGHGIVTHGTMTSEQAFVNYSSVCFSAFVKFFADYLVHIRAGESSAAEKETMKRVLDNLSPMNEINDKLMTGPFATEEDVYRAVSEAGKPVVRHGLVDSVMGNVSYLWNGVLFISQTGSFLDALEKCIDPCPIDNSSCAGITASTELPTHLAIVRGTSKKAVLHGHPKFSVIMSLFCEKHDCPNIDACNTKCVEQRHLGDIPIVPGESGTGKFAIVNTVPPALADSRGAIVYGHGVFTTGAVDFNEPFQNLVDIERMARTGYFNLI